MGIRKAKMILMDSRIYLETPLQERKLIVTEFMRRSSEIFNDGGESVLAQCNCFLLFYKLAGPVMPTRLLLVKWEGCN